jgi:hypothetical protein
MLKAAAQLGPFLGFLLVTAALGGAVVGLAAVVGRRGHRRRAGWMLVASGIFFVAGGVLLFAPQPLWVGVVLVVIGVVRLGRRPSDRLESRR